MAAEPKPRIMSWRTRIAFAVVLGSVTTLAVVWFAALFPVENWLEIDAPVSGIIILDHKPGECWCAGASGRASCIASCVSLDLCRYDGYDEDRRALLYSVGGSTFSSPLPADSDAALRRCVDIGTLSSVPRRQ